MPLDLVEISGEERARWDTSVPDWQERIREGRSLVPDLPIWDEPAERALRIFKRLRVPDLPLDRETGLPPTYGEVCAPWVFDLVRVIFGSFDPERQVRLLQEFFLLVPKKNGKSAIASAIILTAAIMNERPNALLLLLAPTIEVARIAFDQCEGIIRLDPELDKLFHCRGNNIRTITNRITNAVIAIKGADTDTVTGGKPSFILIDETHEFARRSNAKAVFLEARGGLASRPEGFLLQITTQSKTPPSGVFKDELDRARAVRDGEVSGLPVLAILYELPPDLAEQWRDRKTWNLVNPNLGRSVRADFLEAQLIAAEREGRASLALLASQHFNVEIGVGLKGDSWIGATYWAGAALAPAQAGMAGLAAILDRCDVAVAGVDGGGLDDLLGLAVTGRERDTLDWLTWFRVWGHPDVLIRRKEIASRLEDFAQAGDLVLLGEDDPTGDILGVGEIAETLLTEGMLPEKNAIGLDPAGVTALVDEMSRRGLEHGQMVAIPQGYRMSQMIWGMERRLKDGTYRHFGQPMMDWVLGNAKTEQRGSAVLITKETAGKAKIDPLVAGFNAFDLMARNPAARAGAVTIPSDYAVF